MKKLLLVSLLVLSFVMPAEALRNSLKFEFFNNVGGLNDKLSSIVIKDDEASAIQNVNFTLGGAIKKRNGYASDNNVFLAGSCTGLYEYVQNDGTRILIATGGDKIHKYDALDGTPDDITGGETISSNSSVLFDFTTANNKLLATNRTNPVLTWEGGLTVTVLAGAPKGQWIAFHQNIVFIANTSTNPSRLQFSNVLDETTWTSTDWIDVGKDDGSQITGLVVLLDTLYIFKDSSIYRLSGTNRDDFVLSRMVADTGTVSGHTIQVINNKIIFQDTDGVYLYDGGINVTKLSTKIDVTMEGLDESRNDKNVSANFSRLNQYWLSATSGSSSQHNLILVYDYFHNAWTRYTNLQAHALVSLQDTGSKEQVYAGDFDLGAIYLQDSGTNDDGRAINAFYQTKWYRFPSIKESEKVLRLVRTFASEEGSWNLTIEAKKDFAATTTSTTLSLAGVGGVYGTAIYGTGIYGGDQVVIGRFHPEIRENFFQLKFSNINADEPFTVFGWQMFVEPQERR